MARGMYSYKFAWEDLKHSFEQDAEKWEGALEEMYYLAELHGIEED